MVGQFFKSLLRFCFYVAIFVVLAWVFLGIPPYECYTRAKTNTANILSHMGTFGKNIHKTAGDMKAAGDAQLEDANARFHGHDLGLERVDRMLLEGTKDR